MNRKTIARLTVVLCLTMVFALLAGCSGGSSVESEEPERNEPCYPIGVDGTEILIGETKVQALLDLGYEVTWSDMDENNQITEYVVDPETELDPNTYYSGASVSFTEHTFAHISLVTDDAASTLGDATIAYLEFYFSFEDSLEDVRNISFNGVAIPDLTRDKAQEMFPDFDGDDGMWFSKGLDYEYMLTYDREAGTLTGLEAEREYDVDWNG